MRAQRDIHARTVSSGEGRTCCTRIIFRGHDAPSMSSSAAWPVGQRRALEFGGWMARVREVARRTTEINMQFELPTAVRCRCAHQSLLSSFVCSQHVQRLGVMGPTVTGSCDLAVAGARLALFLVF